MKGSLFGVPGYITTGKMQVPVHAESERCVSEWQGC